MSSNSGGGTKRPREPDDEDDNYPKIRIKSPREIKEEAISEEEEFDEPKTPPIPRTEDDEGEGHCIPNNIKEEAIRNAAEIYDAEEVPLLFPAAMMKQEIPGLMVGEEWGEAKIIPEALVAVKMEDRGSERESEGKQRIPIPDDAVGSVGVVKTENVDRSRFSRNERSQTGTRPASKDSDVPCSSRQAAERLERDRSRSASLSNRERANDEINFPAPPDIVKPEPVGNSTPKANDRPLPKSENEKRRIPPPSRSQANGEEDWENENEDDDLGLNEPEVIFFNVGLGAELIGSDEAKSGVNRNQPTSKQPKAGYYNTAPEEEQQYGVGTIAPIPIYVKKTKSTVGSDHEDEGSDNEGKKGREGQSMMPMQTRYYMKKSVYEKYDFITRKVKPESMAVYEQKAQILNVLENSRVLIIEGFTGCGKTTQVPQYILDQCKEEQKFCNIVVTQPRKIAAISVAKRVCYERCWGLGTIVGYQVGMEAKRDKDETLLTFVTTGVLLQQLISKKSLKDYTHIIIDEVHERDLESDFLLLLIRKIMTMDVEGKEQHVKLILMSATIKTKQFETYFALRSPKGDIVGPKVVKIPSICRYNVEEIYLDDILRRKGQMDLLNQIDTNLDKEKATIQDDIYEKAVEHIIDLDQLEKEAITDPRLRNRDGHLKERGSVLVFLPGMEEIKRMERVLDKAERDSNIKTNSSNLWVIVPLHSSISSEDQSRVFDPAKGGMRKIILSTNIAESSVTVPDIAYVYDFCLTKSLCIDRTTNFTTLRLIWAAKSQCVQRRGRAGRVANGKVFRLIPKSFYDTLDDEIVPEMKRSNLETIILQCKKFELDSPKNLLSEALDKPDLSGIQRATATLKELGALTIEMKTRNGFRYDDCDGDLTFVGKIMADLPIPQQCTRLILLGHCFGVMQEAVIIAAGISVKSPFQTGFKKQLDMYLKKMDHAKNTFSDLFALYSVYKVWSLKYAEGYKRGTSEWNWARTAQVHLPVLREIKSTVYLLEERLKRLGVTDSYSLAPHPTNPEELTGDQGIFLKLAIAGAFYPRYFLRRRPDLRQYERDLQRDVNGMDVFRTVYFRGFPKENKGELYAKYVADYLSHGLNIPAIRFDGQKVLAIFDNSTGSTIGPFNRGIFRAIKLRQLRTETLEFKVLWPDKEKDAIAAWNAKVSQRRCTFCPKLRMLPPIDCHSRIVKVQHIVSPSQFWVVLEQDFKPLQNLCDRIMNDRNCNVLDPRKLYPNSFCLAPYQNCYYRGKILRVEPTGDGAPSTLVYFVDYGNSNWISSSVLYDFSPQMIQNRDHEIPCMAIECRLKELKPNILHGLEWNPESIALMEKFRNKADITEFEIYSVHDSVMIGELVGYNKNYEQRCSLNDLLTTKNTDLGTNKIYGEYAPEPYFSNENHRRRQRCHITSESEKRHVQEEQVGVPLNLDFIDPPKHAKTPCLLKGPWSPLEMNFQALVHCSNTKEVRIENSSVNSVLLDHEPTASNSRMLVAAHVGVVERSQSVMVRESTIMPSVAGILSLVCLMFAPKAELRVDLNMTKYTGLLCGCGTVPGSDKIPIHPDNDMEIVFDTEIDDDDITEINIIRGLISSILRTGRGSNKAEFHKKLRLQMLRLLQKKRKKIDEEVWPQEEYVWDRVDPEFLYDVQSSGLSFSHEDIFQPIRRIRLNTSVPEDISWDEAY